MLLSEDLWINIIKKKQKQRDFLEKSTIIFKDIRLENRLKFRKRIFLWQIIFLRLVIKNKEITEKNF